MRSATTAVQRVRRPLAHSKPAMTARTAGGSLMQWVVAAAALLLLCGPVRVQSGRILCLFHFTVPSHFIAFEPLFKELAARGHQVDVVSHFPQKKPLPNYRDISLVGYEPSGFSDWTFDTYMNLDFFALMHVTWVGNVDICRKAMGHPFMKKLSKNPEPYDLVFLEVFGSDCAYGYAHKIGAPVIGMTSLVGLPYGQERVGNPDNPAYVPVANLPFTSHMTLWERTLNTLGQLYAIWGEKLRGRSLTDQLLREEFGENIPPLSELVRNTSLVMVNSHFSFNGARPAVPGYLEVGGMHVSPKRGDLPKDMKDFLDGAGPEGAVLVTFGSFIPPESMPPQKLQTLVKVLGSLPQRVVWRINGTYVPGGLPPNILGKPWVPQQELLSHPKMRAFLTHGGLGATWEALHWGVPMVVVPFITDQRQNAMILNQRGAALMLQFDDITEDSLKEALHAVLQEPRYQENMKKLQREFLDRPMSPMQTAVWWTEYVMRHRGAPQLRSAAVDMPWYQLWLLDVVALVAAAVALLATALCLAVRAVARCLCGGGRRAKQKAS